MGNDREQMPGASAGVEAQIEWLFARDFDFNILTGQRHARARVQVCIRASARQCSQIGFGQGESVAEALERAWTDSQREPEPRAKPKAKTQPRPQTQLSLEDLDL